MEMNLGVFMSERKRQKLEEKRYTQGPLDEEFGQHSAFPLTAAPEGDEDKEVYEYLKQVRREAEEDRSFHFVGRSEPKKSEESSLQQLIVPEATTEKIIETFRAQKQAREDRLSKEEEEEEDAQEDVEAANGEEFVEPESAAQWRKKVFSEDPDPEFLEVLDHTTIIKLIVYYTKWLSASAPTELGKWIFLTFLRLDSDLDHRETAIVRDLAKKAVKVRQKLGDKVEDETQAACKYTTEMTISIVATYFRQRDLLRKNVG